MPNSNTIYTLPFVLRYARHHELCYDFPEENPLFKLNEANLTDESLALPELPNFIAPPTEPPDNSKLQVSQRASELLILAATPPSKPKWENLLVDCTRLRRLKVEQPLLLKDHEKDMKRFMSRRSLVVEDIDFMLETLAKDNDEGLYWPSKIRGLCTQWEKEIAFEKLQISRHTLTSTNCTLRDDWTQEDHNVFVRESLLLKKEPRLAPISPPLMPVDSSFEQPITSSPILRLPMTSDPASLDSLPMESPPQGPEYEDYISVEEKLLPVARLAEYHRVYFNFEDDEMVNYDAGEPSSSTIIEEKRHAHEDSAVEIKAVNGFVSTRSLISHLTIPQLAPYVFVEENSLPSLPLMEGNLPLFGDENIRRGSLKPKLHEAKCKSSSMNIAAFSEQLETNTPDILHGITLAPDLELLTESMEGECYRLPLLKDIIKSQQMLWMPDKLALMKNGAADTDLALELSAKTLENCVLNMKEKISLQKSEIPRHSQQIFRELSQDLPFKSDQVGSSKSLLPAEQSLVRRKRKSLDDIVEETKRRCVSPTKTISGFSASGSLSSFLATRHDEMETSVEEPNSVHEQAGVPVMGNPDTVNTATSPKAPSIAPLRSSRTVFFSSSQVQQHQSLLRFFEAWAGGDTLTIVYREMDAPILLSPKHAVVITNLQALTQRPLPGHRSGGKSAIHDQISIFGQESSFEVLFVFISTPICASSDQTTMLTFSAYCERVSRNSTCHVRPIYIPSGEPELQSWVAKLLVEYALHTRDLVFLQDTTVWERFLVGAGMNSFAAQYVLGQLKDDGSGRVWGLRAFVQMSPTERNQRFGIILGNVVLEGVGGKIDGSILCGESV